MNKNTEFQQYIDRLLATGELKSVEIAIQPTAPYGSPMYVLTTETLEESYFQVFRFYSLSGLHYGVEYLLANHSFR